MQFLKLAALSSSLVSGLLVSELWAMQVAGLAVAAPESSAVLATDALPARPPLAHPTSSHSAVMAEPTVANAGASSGVVGDVAPAVMPSVTLPSSSFNRYYASSDSEDEKSVPVGHAPPDAVSVPAAVVVADSHTKQVVQQLVANVEGLVAVVAAQSATMDELARHMAATKAAIQVVEGQVAKSQADLRLKLGRIAGPIDGTGNPASDLNHLPLSAGSAGVSLCSAPSNGDVCTVELDSLASARSDASNCSDVRVLDKLDAVLFSAPPRHPSESQARPLSPVSGTAVALRKRVVMTTEVRGGEFVSTGKAVVGNSSAAGDTNTAGGSGSSAARKLKRTTGSRNLCENPWFAVGTTALAAVAVGEVTGHTAITRSVVRQVREAAQESKCCIQ